MISWVRMEPLKALQLFSCLRCESTTDQVPKVEEGAENGKRSAKFFLYNLQPQQWRLGCQREKMGCRVGCIGDEKVRNFEGKVEGSERIEEIQENSRELENFGRGLSGYGARQRGDFRDFQREKEESLNGEEGGRRRRNRPFSRVFMWHSCATRHGQTIPHCCLVRQEVKNGTGTSCHFADQ